MNAVFSMSCSLSGIWKNPWERSKLVNHLALPSCAMNQSLRGIGYTVTLVREFRER